MAHADFSRASAQSAANILCSYLAAQGHTLVQQDAADICEALALATMADIKASARPLRDALRERDIDLKQSHALEILAHIAGHDCYMRAKQAVAEPRAVHVLLCTVDGETRQPKAFASIGKCITRYAHNSHWADAVAWPTCILQDVALPERFSAGR